MANTVISVSVSVDVPSLQEGIGFYGEAFGFETAGSEANVGGLDRVAWKLTLTIDRLRSLRPRITC
jgi:hypothetical protein